MRLKRHIDTKYVFLGCYILLFVAYIVYGLQPAKAVDYEISANLAIPSIGLVSDVTTLKLEDHELKTPDFIVGRFSNHRNKTLLIGHSSTVFQDLDEVKVGDEIFYDEAYYHVTDTEVLAKADINMNKILAMEDEETIIIMTCAGEDLGGGDATHRLIITALAE